MPDYSSSSNKSEISLSVFLERGTLNVQLEFKIGSPACASEAFIWADKLETTDGIPKVIKIFGDYAVLGNVCGWAIMITTAF